MRIVGVDDSEGVRGCILLTHPSNHRHPRVWVCGECGYEYECPRTTENLHPHP